MVPSGLYARLCHAFLVNEFVTPTIVAHLKLRSHQNMLSSLQRTGANGP